ncbi:DUF393 domain-containing protein [Zobellia amurskyensis]|uniref:DUF393 domain-containing protein n=1 Tax=Zobellia amurskyensis TaxID=248905 RepID=A0A7X3D0N0_9FLAO|nr:DCC1-like thiol-disulfide oxidoreductase family protein [Zobellia amurskyensis]MUH34608.1 DUF393 domain-containing protein [Zobellia amurskyensis]
MQMPTHSSYVPKLPLLIWDGKCGFCKYWVTRWQKITSDKVQYIPYQDIQEQIDEIPEQAFKQAVRMIETNGKIYSGAHAAYRTLYYSSRWSFLISWYEKSALFKAISDASYKFIAHYRPVLFKLTKTFFGKNP